MKINGGYQFPGSNSGIDLHALTGWIPEEVKISTPNSTSPTTPTNVNTNGTSNTVIVDRESLWKRMFDGFQLGKCLITISTGHLDKPTEEQVGLYANHAYALLDIREVKVPNGFQTPTIKRLIKVKNPWTKKRWKGPYSPNDLSSWTVHLRKELNYDLSHAGQHDNGVFWMNYESLLKYFQTVHFSWNPDLFPYTEIKHSCWESRSPTLMDGTDHHTMNGNPQFRLKLHGKGSVWIMLTKHFTSLEERDRDYLTFHVHRGSSSSGDTVYRQGIDRVFYNENTLIHKGRYSNDPHYRICLNSEDAIKPTTSKKKRSYSGNSDAISSREQDTAIFRIVLSQHSKIQTIRYSLFCYSTVPCTLEPIPYTYRYFKTGQDQWTSTTCGGSCNQVSTYRLNPQYLIYCAQGATSPTVSPNIVDKTNLRFSLSCSQPLDVNIMVFCNQGQPIHLPAKELMIASSGNYRRCFAMCKLSNQELTYFQKRDLFNPNVLNSVFPLTVVLSNFSGSLGDFEFRVESTHTPVDMKKIV